MPTVQITLAAGRTPEQKRALLEGLTRVVVETTGAEAEAVNVLLYELPVVDIVSRGENLADRRARAAGVTDSADVPAASGGEAPPAG
jgi:4-oxalocrotonate tautomerase